MKLPGLLMALCVAFLAGCTTPQSPAPRGALTTEARFLWVAFHGDDGTPHPLMRWEEPIRAVTIGASARDRQKAENHLSLIADLTGLAVSIAHADKGEIGFPVDLTADHNMALVFDSADALFPYSRTIAERMGTRLTNPDHFSCAAQPFMKDGRVAAAAILIRNDITPASSTSETVSGAPLLRRTTAHPFMNLIRGCIAQETTQSLGLTGDLDNHSDTIFSSRTIYIHPTEADRRLVQILYDPRLEPGMTEQQAAPIVRQIVAENDW